MLNLIKLFKQAFGFSESSDIISDPQVIEAMSTLVPYLLNDPTTPELVIDIELPDHPKKLDFGVKGYNRGIIKKIGSPQHQAANCYITVANCIHYMQSIISQSQQPVQRWAAVKKLSVVPRNGKMLNAYYDRKGLKFFWANNPKTKGIIYTADSADIVAHELGHAILDAMRPDFWSVQALEIWSFHEAFADVTAMLSLMQYDEVILKALSETDGDLSKPNVISKLGEEMGDVISHMTRGQHKAGSLRDASRNFKYVDPSKLPKQAPPTKLAAECHSFGRIFLGAWYDIFVGIYEDKVKKGVNPLKAVKSARDIAGSYFIKAVPKTPRVVKYYNAAAKLMLTMDRLKGSPYQALMKGVFKRRNILIPKVKMLSSTTWEDLRPNIEKNDILFKKKNMMGVCLSRPHEIKLEDSKEDIGSLSFGKYDLSKLSLEVPMDSYYEFNEDGVLVEEITSDIEEVHSMAHLCATSIAQDGDIGDTTETMWEVVEDKLIRTIIE